MPATKDPPSLPLAPELWGLFLDRAPSPMAVAAGARHIVRYVNPAFCRLLDKTGAEILGEPFQAILPDGADFLALLGRVQRTGKPEIYRAPERPSSHPGFASIAMWPVTAGQGETAIVIQMVEALLGHDDAVAMNEALILGAVQQHKLAEAADLSNIKLQAKVEDGKQHEAEMIALALTDPLTGLANRRRMAQALIVEVGRAERTGDKFCACMLDIDHFKRVNDLYGHEAGDNVLVAIGALLRRHTRPTDIVTRFGGEEFLVLLPHTKLENAVMIAGRIREDFANSRVQALPDPVTASFGVVELGAGEQGAEMLRRADKALYEAKREGRNCVVAG